MARRRLPSLNALRAFVAAGRLGRMKLAAEELAVTHGAVSRQVRELEATLGVRLFEGPKNRLALTEAGRRLLQALTPAFDQIEAAVASVAKENEGVLEVSCLGTFTMRWLIPRLGRFSNICPGVEVRLSADDQAVDFGRERYEIAIRIDDHELPASAEVTALFPEAVGPVFSPSLASRLGLVQAADLQRAPLLRTRTRPQGWAIWAGRSGIDLDDEQGGEFEHFYFMLEAATAGLGVCVAPWPLVIDDIAEGRLIAPFGFVPSGYTYVAVRRQRRHRAAERFCEWLAAEARLTPEPPRMGHSRAGRISLSAPGEG